MKPIQFELTLHDDQETKEKMQFLSALETALDHSRNVVPEEFLSFSDTMPLGSKVRITLELVGGVKGFRQ